MSLPQIELQMSPKGDCGPTVVLQITGKQNVSESEFSKELLGIVVEQNQARFDPTEWSLIA